MKKILVVLMSLAGMITGLALTSCGGGGGGGDGSGNLSGTTIVANGPASAYKIKFAEKQKNQAYQATISDQAGSKISEMIINVSRVDFGSEDESASSITYLKGSTAPSSLVSNDNAAFYQILTGVVSTNNAITQLYFANPMTFIYDEKAGTLHWKGKVSFTAIANNVEQEVETEIDRVDYVLYVTKE